MNNRQPNDMAAYLFHQGTNFEAYEFMGFHASKNPDGEAVFRVWAPNAKKVYLTGDFNGWCDEHEMTRTTDGGIYEAFVPMSAIKNGDKYKFKIITADDRTLFKADPYAFYAEKPPLTASEIYLSEPYKWTDSAYLKKRSERIVNPEYAFPMNVYELQLGSWKRHEDGSVLSYSELADELLPYVKQMGYTHIELMPIMEHPFDGSWGYQVTGYYAPTSRHGTPDELKHFIDLFHNAGIGVILDWVPAHFPKDEHGLCEFDGEPLYEFQGKDRMEHTAWGTRKFDIARNEVECFLISNAVYWIKEFHADGLRVDAVASMLYLDYDKKPGEWNPNIYGGNQSLEAIAFFKKLNGHICGMYPDVLMIAEESTAFDGVTRSVADGGLGFSYKWNMGWMNDTLSYAQTEFDYRHDFHEKTNFSMMYAYSERYVLPISHDEVVHGKKSFLDRMPGDYWRKFAGSRLFLSYMMFHPGKKLSFMGIEIGQFREWDFEGSIEWFLLDYDMHKKHQSFVRDLNEFYLTHSQLWQNDHSWEGFRWLRPDDRNNSVSSFFRINPTVGEYKELTVVLNYDYPARENFVIDVPHSGVYREIFNSDREEYGGSGCFNGEPIDSFKGENGKDLLSIKLPPLGVCVFELQKRDSATRAESKYKAALKEKKKREESEKHVETENPQSKPKAKAERKTESSRSKKAVETDTDSPGKIAKGEKNSKESQYGTAEKKAKKLKKTDADKAVTKAAKSASSEKKSAEKKPTSKKTSKEKTVKKDS